MRGRSRSRDGDGVDTASRSWDELDVARERARSAARGGSKQPTKTTSSARTPSARTPSPTTAPKPIVASPRALDPHAMLVFAAVARAGGVRGAAATLGMPRSTVSRRLADLEDVIGAPLVVRTGRRFAMTEIGSTVFARSEQLEELLRGSEDLVELASGEPSGVLRIAAAPVLGEEILPEVLSELLARHPKLGVEVRLGVDYVDLRAGEVDVALRAWPLPDASDIFATKLGTSVTGCYVSPSYAAVHGVPERRPPISPRTHASWSAARGRWSGSSRAARACRSRGACASTASRSRARWARAASAWCGPRACSRRRSSRAVS